MPPRGPPAAPPRRPRWWRCGTPSPSSPVNSPSIRSIPFQREGNSHHPLFARGNPRCSSAWDPWGPSSHEPCALREYTRSGRQSCVPRENIPVAGANCVRLERIYPRARIMRIEATVGSGGFNDAPSLPRRAGEFTTQEREFTTQEREFTTQEREFTTQEREFTTQEREFTTQGREKVGKHIPLWVASASAAIDNGILAEGGEGKMDQSTVRVPLIAAVSNSRVPILAASEPTTVATYPGDFGTFNSRCP
eukprot:1193278-Prorocentrum_minimum.AAC.7